MRLFEIVEALKEGCEYSNAWITIGGFDGINGAYICIAIPAGKINYLNYCNDSVQYGDGYHRLIYGWRIRKGQIQYTFNRWTGLIKVLYQSPIPLAA